MEVLLEREEELSILKISRSLFPVPHSSLDWSCAVSCGCKLKPLHSIIDLNNQSLRKLLIDLARGTWNGLPTLQKNSSLFRHKYRPVWELLKINVDLPNLYAYKKLTVISQKQPKHPTR